MWKHDYVVGDRETHQVDAHSLQEVPCEIALSQARVVQNHSAVASVCSAESRRSRNGPIQPRCWLACRHSVLGSIDMLANHVSA